MLPCLHQERPEMYSSSRCKNTTDRAVKLSRLKGVGICPRTQSCVNWGEPIAMVLCLHQGNIYMKRELRLWRDHKCIPLVGAKTPLTCAGRQTTAYQGVGIGPRTQTCANLGGPIAMVPCLYRGNIYIKRKLRVRIDQKCISLVGSNPPLTCAGRQTAPSQLSRYRTENGNLRKLGCNDYLNTVLPPRQYLYQNEATCMEIPEMYSSSRWKNPSYLSEPSNYSVSRESV